MNKKLVLVLYLFFLTPFAIAASSFNPQEFLGFEVIIPKEQKLETDVRIIAANAEIEGEITGEAIVTGANVQVSGALSRSSPLKKADFLL